jgi:5-methylcytosine-specific restriction endonuclease McrA
MKEKRAYRERRQYLIKAVRQRRKKVRQMAVEYKGGKCQRCSYDRCLEALEFHHVKSTGKDFGISDRGYTRSWKKIREEVDKCVLLCANCHREVHSELQLPREIVDEKSGELREACPPQVAENGNPEPSLVLSQ